MDDPKIMIQEKVLSILVALDENKFCAYCPELDFNKNEFIKILAGE